MKNTQLERLDKAKKTVVFIIENTWSPKNFKANIIWTWFFVEHKKVSYVVTCKSTIAELDYTGAVKKEKENLYVWFNINDPKRKALKIQFVSLTKMKENWHTFVYHTNSEVFTTMIPIKIPTDIAVCSFENTSSDFIDKKRLFETHDIYMMWYQKEVCNLEEDKKIIPVVKKWTIAKTSKNKSFYINISTNTGGYWSPVFAKSKWVYKIIWIIQKNIMRNESSIDTNTMEISLFEENSWFSRMESANLLYEIMKTELFIEQHNRIYGLMD